MSYNAIPQGWEEKTLGELGLFSKGTGIAKAELVDIGISCVRYGEIYTTHNIVINKCTSFIQQKSAANSSPIFSGDILFAGSGETKEEIGKCVVFIDDYECYAGGDIIIFRPNDINSIFLSYYLNIIARKQLDKLGQGHSVVHIYKDNLVRISILLPPLAEQEKIVEILNTCDKVIENYSKILELKTTYKKASMQNLLSGKVRFKGFHGKWEAKKLRDVADIIGGGTPPTNNKKYWNGDIPWITPKDITMQAMKFISGGERTITLLGLQNCSAKILPKHTVLLTSRAPVGNLAIAHVSLATNQGFQSMISKNNAHYLFLYYLLYANVELIKKYTNGSTFQEISKPTLENIIFPFPPLPEQEAIAEVLTTADNEIEKINALIAQYKQFKKFLMQNLLTGKIRVKV